MEAPVGIVQQQGVVGDDGVGCAPAILVATPGPPGGQVQLLRLWYLSVDAGAHVAEDDLPDLLLLDVVVAGDEVSRLLEGGAGASNINILPP